MTSPVSSQAQENAPAPWRSSAVAHTATTFQDGFWGPRLQAMREGALPAIYEQMRADGHFDNFHKQWDGGVQRTPYVFWESDISKWIEAASYSLATHPDAALASLVDEVIAFLVAQQQPDGYLNLWYTRAEPEMRWSNLRDNHELYCAGHLIEAAVAHFQATGKRELLDAACRYADYIATVFGVEEGQRRGYPGHEEIELALVKLYHATGQARYLRLCQYFIEERGRRPHYFDSEAVARGEAPADFWATTYEYNQSHLPVREQQEVVGHAVRAMYLLSAVADLARELDDPSLQQTCERLWLHLTSKRLYITGALGSSADNEGFTNDYELPNLAAYAETCAAIGLVMWSYRMLLLDTQSRYADVLEQALYNGVLSGVASDGTSYFYVNPLESQGAYHRQPWYKCACCPPNLARLFLSLGQYLYTVNEREIMVHLYAQSTSTIELGTHKVTLHQHTNYPWDGTVEIEIEVTEPVEFGLNTRIPGWCKEAQMSIAGEEIPLKLRNGYACVRRVWNSGDRLVVYLAMPVERVYAHPAVRATTGSVALRRGPLVYCLEATDHTTPLHQLRLPRQAPLEEHFAEETLGGVTLIKGLASALESGDWSNTLYRTTPPIASEQVLTAIPYYAWGQRAAGEMRVWINEEL
ncbi:MAG TPA: beta-L-arabinofuranosidase domain-containing protein [Ktedonobacteraceae bacterium]|nr:beta-L-arabinofuranosidase domain-containing protein [Ktedonobacteraceae bacterium]